MKKYMIFGWVIDGTGWYVKETLEEAKNVWCFGIKVFEINAEDKKDLFKYGREVQSNRLLLERLQRDYPLVFQNGEPPAMFITK
jgi:hypothetical protein